MATAILVIGESGSGKSTSLKTLNPETTYLIQVANKDLPFKGWAKMYRTKSAEHPGNRKVLFPAGLTSVMYGEKKSIFSDTYNNLNAGLWYINNNRPEIKTIVIDDSQYILSYEFIARAKEKGYDKYNEIAQHFFDIVSTSVALRDDLTVIFLHHSEMSEGKKKAKTLGKMLDNVLTLEGMFTVVLEAQSRKNGLNTEYFFITNNDASSVAKSPQGMFPDEIANDMQSVLNSIIKFNEGD